MSDTKPGTGKSPLHNASVIVPERMPLDTGNHVGNLLREGPHIESRRVGLHEAPYRR